MLISSRFLFCVLLLCLPALSGCEMFSSEAWQRPTPYSAAPPPPPEKHEGGGGFTVLVGLPDQPTAPRVFADLGAFAQRRGFMRQSAQLTVYGPNEPVPERYALGDIRLDVVYQAAGLRVVASLHSFSSKLNRKFVDRFYQDFRQEYAARYGAEGSISENDYIEDTGGLPREGGGHSGKIGH